MPKLARTRRQGPVAQNHSQGIGYFIPDSLPIDQWRLLKSKWDAILASSGFNDLEMFDRAHTGHFLPTFKQNSIEKNTKTQAGAIPEGISGYYSYCSTFYELADWQRLFNNKRFKCQWRLMRELMRLHKDGVSYGDMRQALQGKQSSYMVRFNIKASTRWYQQKRSKYWLFIQMSAILEVMWLWHCTAPEGALTPYDLDHMQCTGITAEVRARAHKSYVPRVGDSDSDVP